MRRHAQWVCVMHGGLWGDNESCPKCLTGEPLPYDPDGPTNADRASWARSAVLAFAARNRHYEFELDPDNFSEIVGDLLGDLHHLRDEIAAQYHRDPHDPWGNFDVLDQRAEVYYTEECEEEA